MQVVFPEIPSDVLEPFTLPHTGSKEEQRLLADFVETVPKRYDTALVIGRFQPLHYGHLFLMKQALGVSENLIIGIGSSNITDADNPFSLSRRTKMLTSALKRETGIRERVTRIIPLPDVPDDALWLHETIRAIPDFQAVAGNNEWVNGIFRKAHYPVIETPLYFRKIYEGRLIRAKLRKMGFEAELGGAQAPTDVSSAGGGKEE